MKFVHSPCNFIDSMLSFRQTTLSIFKRGMDSCLIWLFCLINSNKWYIKCFYTFLILTRASWKQSGSFIIQGYTLTGSDDIEIFVVIKSSLSSLAMYAEEDPGGPWIPPPPPSWGRSMGPSTQQDTDDKQQSRGIHLAIPIII